MLRIDGRENDLTKLKRCMSSSYYYMDIKNYIIDNFDNIFNNFKSIDERIKVLIQKINNEKIDIFQK